MADFGANRVSIAGTLEQRGALRYSPAGQSMLDFSVRHASEQMEAGFPRRVECGIEAVAVGLPGQMIAGAPLGTGLLVSGFLAARSARTARLVLHVTEVEFLEDKQDGFQTQVSTA